MPPGKSTYRDDDGTRVAVRKVDALRQLPATDGHEASAATRADAMSEQNNNDAINPLCRPRGQSYEHESYSRQFSSQYNA